VLSDWAGPPITRQGPRHSIPTATAGTPLPPNLVKIDINAPDVIGAMEHDIIIA
jgi:hypothetical protein